MRQAHRIAGFVAALSVVVLLIVGCSGSNAPTLPSPDGGGNTYRVTLTAGGAGISGDDLPDTLGASNFAVTLDGTSTRVISAERNAATTRPLFLCFIIDTTGSMSGTIDGVKSSIQAFADTFSGRSVTWAGVEYGDDTPLDGTRTKFDPSTDLSGFKTWIGTLYAHGGGDGPENPLDCLMESKLAAPNGYGWSIPTDADRYYIVLTDIGAHERGDGTSYCSYTGDEVLAAFRGWAVVNCVSPDWSSYWATPTAVKSNDGVSTLLYRSGYGWDVRELADGGPADKRTNSGTGGIWVQMPSGGSVDLTTLGITSLIAKSYTVVFEKPTDLTSADLVLKATWSGGSATWTYSDYTF
jgi:hypothetical protein